MRVWLYSFSLFLYRQTLRLVSKFHAKAKLWSEGQDHVWESLEEKLKNNSKPLIWVHAASLGEFEQGRPIIDALKEKYPKYFILLTFFSPSGYEIRKNYPLVDWVSYLPLDSKSSSVRFLDLVKPQMVIFVKYEYWYFYLMEIQKRNISSLLVSAIFRENSVFFQWYGGFYRNIVKSFSQIFVQDLASKVLLESIQVEQVQVAGDTRFDRVYQMSEVVESWDLAEAFLNGSEFIVLGSVWEADMQMLIPIINSSKWPLKWIIVPHEIHQDELNSWKSQINRPTLFSVGNISDEIFDKEVLIVNEIGRLSTLYKGASFAYIGGSFGKGLHNTLEAAVFGLALFFGNKNFRKFKEACDLIDLGIAFPVANSEEFILKMDNFFQNPMHLEEIKKKSKAYISTNIGAKDQIMNFIQTKI